MTNTAITDTAMPDNLTRIEQKIFNVLADGKAHLVGELRRCIDDSWTENSTVRVHIAHLRRKLRSQGHGITFERLDNTSAYRIVRLVAAD